MRRPAHVGWCTGFVGIRRLRTSVRRLRYLLANGCSGGVDLHGRLRFAAPLPWSGPGSALASAGGDRRDRAPAGGRELPRPPAPGAAVHGHALAEAGAAARREAAA